MPRTDLHYKALPGSIWTLGFVSMFMDISSEMVHGLLPVFLVTILGASATSVGLVEGFAEGIALITRVFSGYLSDRTGKRKSLIITGYLLGTLTKPFFALATSVATVFGARAIDRVGKGIRGSPRDALIADLTPEHQRGAAYGLRQSLDSVGAFIGPLLAIALMTLLHDDFRRVFWLAVIPGLIAVGILVFFIREPERHAPAIVKAPVQVTQVNVLGAAYWTVLGLGIIFTLARFSEAFLLLRAEQLGLAANLVPGILVILSLFFALGAYPAGYLSDRIGRTTLLVLGLVTLTIADIVLAMAHSVLFVIIGSAIWGLHMAFTQGIFSALVADTCAQNLRGTAFGIFGLATGTAIIIASVLAGWLWDQYGAFATFLAGAGFSLLTLMGMLVLRKMRGTFH
jgi:MFS family permease